MENCLTLEEIKELLTFCKENRIHKIRVGNVEAELSPDDIGPSAATSNRVPQEFPKWVTGD